MLNVFTIAQAKKAARALEKSMERQGLTLPYGKALDAIASMQGYADWNGLSKALQPEALDAQLCDIELEHIANNQDSDYGREAMLVAHTGFQLRYSAESETCDYVRVCDPLGRELAYWVDTEWQEDPALVMGAILGALVRGRPQEPVVSKNPVAPAVTREVTACLPRIQDIDFRAVSRISIGGGDAMQVHHTDQDILKLLADPKSDLAEENADVTGVLLYEVDDDFREFKEDLTLERLASLTWSSEQKCFVDPEGTTYEFYFPVTTEQFLSLSKPNKSVVRAAVSDDNLYFGSESLEGKPYQLYDVQAKLNRPGKEPLPMALKRVAGRSKAEALEQFRAINQYPEENVPSKDIELKVFDLSQFMTYAVYIDGGLYQREIPHLETAINFAEVMVDNDPAAEVIVEDADSNEIWRRNPSAQ